MTHPSSQMVFYFNWSLFFLLFFNAPPSFFVEFMSCDSNIKIKYFERIRSFVHQRMQRNKVKLCN